MSLTAGDVANQRMVDRLIAEGALWSPRLISAFRHTPRHRFLDHICVFQHRHDGWREVNTREPGAQEIDLMYSDRALITRLATVDGGHQVAISSSSQPSLMAEMLEDLRPQQGQRVLEIGAGTGYNAALLAHVVGAGLVHSVDVDQGVLADAAEHIASFSDRSIQLHHGDGRQGWADAAPFDRVIVTAATPDFEPAWLAQTKDGGVLVAPLVLGPGMSFVARGRVHQETFHGGLTRGAYFMPLRAEDETPREQAEMPVSSGPLKTRPAPWAGWFDRQRPRVACGSFLQSLVFFGWLRGLSILQTGVSSVYANYGVSSGDAQCWFSSEDWQVNGDTGHELAETLWQAWLRAGGPWLSEYRLTASASGIIQPSGPERFARRGPLCHQVWELGRGRKRSRWR